MRKSVSDSSPEADGASDGAGLAGLVQSASESSGPQKSAICNCHYCGSLIQFNATRAGQMVNCVHCGKETVLCDPDFAPPYGPEKCRLPVTSLEWEKDECGMRYLVGEIVNQSSGNLDWIKIEFRLHGDSEGIIGSTSDTGTNVPAGRNWRFRAPVFDPSVQRASLLGVVCEYGRSQLPETLGIRFTPHSMRTPERPLAA